MIPVDFNEAITCKDEESGVSFSIRPMVGPNEAKLVELISGGGESDTVSRASIDEIFDMFVAGWSHPELKLPQFPGEKPHQMFSISDRNKMVFEVILKQSKSISSEEKKS